MIDSMRKDMLAVGLINPTASKEDKVMNLLPPAGSTGGHKTIISTPVPANCGIAMPRLALM